MDNAVFPVSWLGCTCKGYFQISRTARTIVFKLGYVYEPVSRVLWPVPKPVVTQFARAGVHFCISETADPIETNVGTLLQTA